MENNYIERKRKQYQIAKLISAGVATASVVCAMAGAVVGVRQDKELRNLSEDLSDEIKTIKQSEVYAEHINETSESLYNAYKSGELSITDFSKALEEINSDNYVVENAYELSDNDTAEKIVSIDNDIKTTRKEFEILGWTAASIAVGVAMPAGAAYLVADEKSKEFER